MNSRLVAKTIFGCAISVACTLGTSLFGQGAKADGGRFSDIPGESIAVASLEFETLVQQPGLELLPWEIWSAASKEELGIDVLEIATVDLAVGMPLPSGPEFGLSIRLKKPTDIAAITDRWANAIDTSPKNPGLRIRELQSSPDIQIAQASPQVILIGSQGMLARMTGGKVKPSKLTDLVRTSKSVFRIGLEVEQLRPMILGALDGMVGRFPEEIVEDTKTLLENTTNILAELSPGLNGTLRLSFGADTPKQVQGIDAALQKLRTDGTTLVEEQLNERLEQDSQMSDAVRTATQDYMKRIKTVLANKKLWKAEGNRVAVETELNASLPTIGVLTGLLLPAVTAARQAASNVQSSNNLRQLGLALLNHESAYRVLPGRAILDDDDEPLLSWRVKILPFLEQQQLYNEFHHNEAWDSPHNIALLERMPVIFRNPRSTAPPGYTVYVAPYGEDYLWNDLPTRLPNIADGTSNTVALMEVNDEHAVPWTAPEDLNLDENAILDCFRAPGSLFLFFDGHVQLILNSIDSDVLEAILTPNGGEVVQLP